MGLIRTLKKLATAIQTPDAGYAHFFIDENGIPRVKDEDGNIKDFTSGIIAVNGVVGNVEICNNEGKIKANWTDPNLPNSGTGGFTANVVKQIPLNNSYSLSSFPVTKYPKKADPALLGGNMIDPSTGSLREIVEGQDALWRVRARYRNKGAGNNNAIGLTIYNPNPSSSFSRTLFFPTPDNITSITMEFVFLATADSISLNPAFGYNFESFSTGSDGNLVVEILDIKSEYLATEIEVNAV